MARKNLLKGFKRPKGITYETSESSSTYGKFIAYPFEPGYGTTIGNTLRRILLSSIQGYAITAVRIVRTDADGAQHTVTSEFETIPGVVEDTIEVLNALKQLRMRLPNDEEQGTYLFELSGPADITGASLVQDKGLEVLNPEIKLCTLMDGVKLDLEMQIDLGRGYVPSEVNEKYIEVVGTIPMDAIFSPDPSRRRPRAGPGLERFGEARGIGPTASARSQRDQRGRRRPRRDASHSHGRRTAATHYAANNPGVREHLVQLQRQAAGDDNIVTEGRDQGTVVFPQPSARST